MTGALCQLRALVALRWSMARAPGVRLVTLLAALLVLWLLAQVVRTGPALDVASLSTALELAPAAYLSCGLLALLAPLTSPGGHVVPPDQLVAYPVRPATHLLSGLLLAPLNLVWLCQLLALAALTSCLTLSGSLLSGSVTTLAYVFAVTVAGQVLTWLLVGLRQTRGGRRAVGLVAAGLGVALVLSVRAGHTRAVLELSPTHRVVDAVIAGGDGQLLRWAQTTGALLLIAGVGLGLGVWVCRWALRRAGDAGATVTGLARRRRTRSSALWQLVAVDRASVWRAPALRRGAVALAVLPGLLAAGAALPWSSLVVLPGLVATGAALLFGVNAFGLDGSGQVWLSSLPHDPRLALAAKAVVVTETVLAAVVLTTVAGAARSPAAPTAAEVAALATSALVAPAVVIALAMRASVRRPHRADLRGPRDAILPPGALAVASAWLALPTGVLGILVGVAGGTGLEWLPPALGLPVLALCWLSAVRTVRLWTDPAVRARVVQTVAAG